MSSNDFHFNLILNDKYFGNSAYSESYRPDYPSHFPQQPSFSTRAHRIESPQRGLFIQMQIPTVSFRKEPHQRKEHCAQLLACICSLPHFKCPLLESCKVKSAGRSLFSEACQKETYEVELQRVELSSACTQLHITTDS
mmetsp:Transcript_87492/g.127944  ORF Transcript_87492/g.127944 Transcript_87492/m.127944 type:complete len:139 (-) Transcript_87492:1368-1784(-)